MLKTIRDGLAVSLLVLAATASPCATLAQTVAANDRVEGRLRTADWADRLWRTAQGGENREFYALLNSAPAAERDARLDTVRDEAGSLRANLDKREADRSKRAAEVAAELDKALADTTTDMGISKALLSAVELYMISTDKQAVLAEARITDLVKRADAAARAAEARGDWLSCSELFYRLDALLDEQGTYKDDVERQNHRLAMLRLYVPQRLWELRNQRQLAAKLDALPPYNPVGDDFRDKLKDVDRLMVVRAINNAGRNHVEQGGLRPLLLGGLAAIKTMAGTPDLRGAFSGLDNEAARRAFEEAITAEEQRLSRAQALDASDTGDLIDRLLEANQKSVGITETAILHEFGNGATEQLDLFSAIVWPDEIARFNRSTQGKLIGIGVEIQFDELSNIRVVTPLEGGPAQKVGVRPGDVIKRVGGKNAYGLTLDQAVDVITGPAGTKVKIVFDRKDPAKPEDPAKEVEFDITRAEIPLFSVKGWKRTGPKEDAWDYMIDPTNGIAYVRMTGFTETTTHEFDQAINTMRKNGAKALILDLRFNPGGLLDQAINVVNRFIDHGPIVMTRNAQGQIERQETARRDQAKLAGMPVVVLINEGSASASEIVSGALQCFGRAATADAVVIGARSYGKGSVQDVIGLPGGKAALKLTTQYYLLPDKRLIHRVPGAKTWGVQPDMTVDMLPAQIADALTVRRNADLWAFDPKNVRVAPANDPKAKAEPQSNNPEDLLTKGLDVQLQTAVLVAQSRTLNDGHPKLGKRDDDGRGTRKD